MSNHFISLAQAEEMTHRFYENQNSVLIPELQDKGILYISETFDRDAFEYLLNETGAAGLRFYNGMDLSLKTRLIAVAVDKDGNDLLPAAGAVKSATADSNQIAEEGQRCPTNCPTGTTLGGR